jgi:pyruvate kinase
MLGMDVAHFNFKEGIDKIHLVKGEQIILTSKYTFQGDKHKLVCLYGKLASSVTTGQQILIADGSLILTVLSSDEPAGEMLCFIENNCSMGEQKNMHLPGVVVDLPTFTDKDVDDIVNFDIKHNADFIAPSFVCKGLDVKYLRQLL